MRGLWQEASQGEPISVTKIVLGLQRRLNLLPAVSPPSSSSNSYTEFSIRATNKQIDLLRLALSSPESKCECARAFVSGGGLAVLRSFALQHKLAHAAVELLALLSRTRLPGIESFLQEEAIIQLVASLCQRSSSSRLHRATVDLYSVLAVDSIHSADLIDALSSLLTTQCHACKATAMKCLAVASLDSSSSLKLLHYQGGEWATEILPTLFRIICDSRISLRRLQFEASQALLFLCLESPSTEIIPKSIQFIRTLILIECFPEGRVLLSQLERWRVKEKKLPPEETKAPRMAHSHVGIARFLIEQLLTSGLESPAATAVFTASLHKTLLLFVLTAEDDARLGSSISTQAVREAREAVEQVVQSLYSLRRQDDRVDAYLTTSLKGQSLWVAVEPHSASTSHKHSVLIASLRAELKTLSLEVLLDQLQNSLSQDSKAHLPLLTGPCESYVIPAEPENKPSSSLTLAYTQIAKLFATNSHDSPSVNDSQLEEVLFKLAMDGTGAASPGRLKKAAPVIEKLWAQPKPKKKRGPQRCQNDENTVTGAGPAPSPRPPGHPPKSSKPFARPSSRPVVAALHQSAASTASTNRVSPRTEKTDEVIAPRLFVGIDLLAIDMLARTALFVDKTPK